jgi:hypothetical protein
MFPFFVYSVEAEQLHVKVCLKLSSWNSEEVSEPGTVGS